MVVLVGDVVGCERALGGVHASSRWLVGPCRHSSLNTICISPQQLLIITTFST
jgi:hypothetical protein